MNNHKHDGSRSGNHTIPGSYAWLLRILHLDSGDRKKKYGYFAGTLSIIINIGLFILKLLFGINLRSISILADAVHSLSDVATSIILIVGIRMSAKPPDQQHPFGHGRAELITSVIIACILIAVGYEFIEKGIGRINTPIMLRPDIMVVLLLAGTIVIKELLARMTFTLGKAVGSAAMHADAWHHRTDSLSTLLVIIGLILYRTGMYAVDGILGIVVGLFIIYTSIVLIRESASSLMGKAPSPGFINRIKMLALSCNGIRDVHHIHVHDYGGKLEITVHIRLKADMPLDTAHEKATEVEACIQEALEDAQVTVHTEPE
ncbi:cation transporter [candidate division WOR-3 bacterium]|nr:cation transporter [candidate division WOR-3 bacterium]